MASDRAEKGKINTSGESINRCVEDLVCFSDYPVAPVLNLLLKDKSTNRNIIWATSSYLVANGGFAPAKEIDRYNVTGFFRTLIQPRVCRTLSEQSHRTRTKAEVFTPGWVCAKMNATVDEALKDLSWQDFVRARCLEITCGEAPFLVSRYDAVTGEIIPLEKRFGILDRKLQKVNAHVTTEKEWLLWTRRAFESTYGYEYQGDSLLIARVNLLNTFCDYLRQRWNRRATISEIKKIANIIVWNIWQMDGLSGRLPDPLNKFAALKGKKGQQLEFFPHEASAEDGACKIYHWQHRRSIKFFDLQKETGKMKFSFVIGNPPYQEETKGDNDTFAPPVYHCFLDEAYKISDRVEMIHPARCLFNAGSTPKEWNQKMLNDPHLTVCHYEADSKKVFPNTDIKGGVAISYRDITKDFGAMKLFVPWNELRPAVQRICGKEDFKSFAGIIYSRTSYRFSEEFYNKNPKMKGRQSKGHDYDVGSNVFTIFPEMFSDKKPSGSKNYIQIYGRLDNARVFRSLCREYVETVPNLDKWKVFIASANGSGAFGEILTSPIVGEPGVGHTETFISVGCFDAQNEAEACIKYVKSKFLRAMLGVLKVTQATTPGKFACVPLQDFTSNSDIDWSQSVAGIDLQLYKKYALTAKEIAFIESHVKGMA